jgi:hypothetical protein
MSIRNAIIKGVKRSRRKLHTTGQLDRFAIDHHTHGVWPTTHGVRARISELTKAGVLTRVAPNQYTLTPTEDN